MQLLPKLQLQKLSTTPPSPFPTPPLSILVKNTILVILFHLHLSLNILTMIALPPSFLSLLTPEEVTGQGLDMEFTEECWVWVPLASQTNQKISS